MIFETKGNLLESDADVLINPVNTKGVMGKGLALQFKQKYPYNFKAYAENCKKGLLKPGVLNVNLEFDEHGQRDIINFPTKTDWRKPSEYSYIEKGLQSLVEYINKYHIRSIAMPMLGCGCGGLDRSKVKEMIYKYLDGVYCTIYLYI